MKLTQPTVNSLGLPPGKADMIFFDDDVPGLGLRLRSGGKRSWIFQYGIGTKQRRMTLGTAPALTLAAARKTASELHARVRLGEDPAAAKREGVRRATETIEAVLRLYLPEKRQALAPASYISLERHLLRYAKPLHGAGVTLTTRRDIGDLLAAIAASIGATSANRTRASLSAFFSWCMARGLTEQNPVIGTHVIPEKSRSRVLSIAELAAIWNACGGDAYGTIVRLLILTGQRREEIGGLRQGEICDGNIVLPDTRTKNRRAHIIPLSAAAQSTLARRPARDGDFVFGGHKPFTSWSFGKTLRRCQARRRRRQARSLAIARYPPQCRHRHGRGRHRAAYRRSRAQPCQRPQGRHRRRLQPRQLRQGKARGACHVGGPPACGCRGAPRQDRAAASLTLGGTTGAPWRNGSEATTSAGPRPESRGAKCVRTCAEVECCAAPGGRRTGPGRCVKLCAHASVRRRITRPRAVARGAAGRIDEGGARTIGATLPGRSLWLADRRLVDGFRSW